MLAAGRRRGRATDRSYWQSLRFLDKKRPKAWLKADSAIRDLAADERETVSEKIAALRSSLGEHRRRRMLMFNGSPLQVWVCRDSAEPPERELRRCAEVACILADASMTQVLRLSYKNRRKLTRVEWLSYARPAQERGDYAALEGEALAEQTKVFSNK